MKSVTSKYSRGLLPTYFKIVGLLVIVLALGSAIIIKVPITPDQKPLAKIITLNILIIGLFLIAWSRDKIEDEMSLHLRFQAMSMAFLFSIMYCVFYPLVSSFFDRADLAISSQQLIIAMLVFFIFIYTFKKRSNK